MIEEHPMSWLYDRVEGAETLFAPGTLFATVQHGLLAVVLDQTLGEPKKWHVMLNNNRTCVMAEDVMTQVLVRYKDTV